MASKRDWTEQEKWVWRQVCEGSEADFNQREGRTVDPNELEEWNPHRILRAQFLESILLYQPFINALNHRGVIIKGAWFNEPINLSEASLSKPLALNECRFDKEVILAHVVTAHWLSLSGSTFYQTLAMHRLQVGGSLRLNKGAKFRDVQLSGAIIRDVLDLRGALFADTLDMNSIQVGTNVLMNERSQFQTVTLSGAKIDGEITTKGSSFEKLLLMTGLQVHGSLFMEKSSFSQVDLRGARIDGHVVMVDSIFADKLDMGGIRVGDELMLRGAKVTTTEDIYLTFAKIDSNLDISGSTLPSLDLTGTQIKGEFRLGSNQHPSVRWQKNAHLILRNTEVASLQDREESWPNYLTLYGFTYNHLGGMTGDGDNDLDARKISWFKEWLEKQNPYSPQPYKQLASVFSKAGQTQKAVSILYENKERERKDIATGLAWLWLTVLKIFIGYGYKTISRISLWVILFTLLGTIMLRISKDNPFNSVFRNNPVVFPTWLHKYLPLRLLSNIERYLPLFVYSFDRFLPLVRLRDYYFTKIELQGWLVYYFYFHQLMGFILASLLIAGITGLTVNE